MARICLGAEKQFQMDTDFEKAPRNLERADQAIACLLYTSRCV